MYRYTVVAEQNPKAKHIIYLLIRKILYAQLILSAKLHCFEIYFTIFIILCVLPIVADDLVYRYTIVAEQNHILHLE